MIHRVTSPGPILRGLALGILAGCLGCERVPGAWLASGSRGGTEVRVATTWSARDRAEADRRFHAENPAGSSIRLAWIELVPGTPFDRAAVHVPAIDVYLGGPRWEYARLAASGAIDGAASEAGPTLRVVRSFAVEARGKEPNSGPSGRPILEDPRVDPVTLTWAQAKLGQGTWLEGYASVLSAFSAAARSAGWQAGSATAGVERTGTDPVWSLQRASLPSEASPEIVYEEWGAVASGATDQAVCRRVLDALTEVPIPDVRRELTMSDASYPELLSDLLGSTLVDAQDELRVAYELLGREGGSDDVRSQARAWLFEPPPWPPAFVNRLQERGGDHALAMVQDLAARVAPDPAARLWLVQSWLRPTRPIDGSFLAELAGAADGRLVRQADFREWLRREWTAWARQRYRRVARLAGGQFQLPG